MDIIMDWKLIYRSPEELSELIQRSAFGRHGEGFSSCNAHRVGSVSADLLQLCAGCLISIQTAGSPTQLFVVVKKK